jgi:hypothetical protein
LAIIYFYFIITSPTCTDIIIIVIITGYYLHVYNLILLILIQDLPKIMLPF